MTARDLLQQRYTLPNGDTAWRSSPLVNAALEGKLVLLDGIHRVNAGTLAVLQRFACVKHKKIFQGNSRHATPSIFSFKTGLHRTLKT